MQPDMSPTEFLLFFLPAINVVSFLFSTTFIAGVVFYVYDIYYIFILILILNRLFIQFHFRLLILKKHKILYFIAFYQFLNTI